MSRTNINFEKKRQDIIRIAEELFIEKGYEKTTLKDILSINGISKGGFYHYFQSKEEIVLACIDGYADQLLEIAEQIIVETSSDVLDKYNTFSHLRSELLIQHQELMAGFRMVFAEEYYRRRIMELLIHKFSRPFGRLLELGNEEKEFEVPEPYTTAELLLSLIFNYGLFTDRIVDGEKKMEALTHILVKSLGAKQPGKIKQLIYSEYIEPNSTLKLNHNKIDNK